MPSYVVNNQAVREDLMAILTNLTPTDNQLVSGLGTSKASSTRHEWLMDTLMAVKTNAFAEGALATEHTLTNPERLLNYTQISRQGFYVSDTERAVNTAAFNDRYAYESQKAMKIVKNDMELALMAGSLLCGSASIVGQVKGIKNWLTMSTSQSGISFSEAIFNAYLQKVWEEGTEVNAAYLPMTLKRRVASWIGAATNKNISVSDKRLINSVSIYEADAASLVKLFAHRHVNVGAVNNDAVLINEDLFKIAYLRKPFIRELSKRGDSTDGEVVVEYTLECLHPVGGILGKAHL